MTEPSVRFAQGGEAHSRSPISHQKKWERVNPVFKGHLDHYTKDDLDAWRDLIHNHILELRPRGTEPITLLWIDDRAELERVFPSFPFGRHSDGDKAVKFISEIPVNREIQSAMILETRVMLGSPNWLQQRPGK